MRQAIGRSRRCTVRARCADKIIDGKNRASRRISRVRLRLSDNVHTFAAMASFTVPTMSAHSMHGVRSWLHVPRRTPLPRVRLTRRGRLSHWLQPGRTPNGAPTAFNGNLVRDRSSTANTPRTRMCLRAMGYEVRGVVARRDPPSVRRIGLRQRFADRAEHCESQHNAPHRNPYRGTRNLLRACALFRLSVAPLHHHHHKFLGGREAAEPLQAIPNPLPAVVPIRMLAKLTTTTLATWRIQFFLLGQFVALPYH